MSKTKKTKLNIGSGIRPLSTPENEWADLDIRETIDLMNGKSYTPDIVANCMKIPVKSGTFEEVLAHSVLEHFNKKEFRFCLAEWYRVLKSGGKIVISVPDMKLVAHSLLEAVGQRKVENIINLIYGEQNYLENQHKWGFTEETLGIYLDDAGFENIRRLDGDRYEDELLMSARK